MLVLVAAGPPAVQLPTGGRCSTVARPLVLVLADVADRWPSGAAGSRTAPVLVLAPGQGPCSVWPTGAAGPRTAPGVAGIEDRDCGPCWCS
ncbi:MAG TPA: hypothetical protein VMV07_21065 [Streptosporangiaceae bacterium]|nr:hypothetical protein [Streptosporangiaceae bacterium]